MSNRWNYIIFSRAKHLTSVNDDNPEKIKEIELENLPISIKKRLVDLHISYESTQKYSDTFVVKRSGTKLVTIDLSYLDNLALTCVLDV